jgi:hypothetical protein
MSAVAIGWTAAIGLPSCEFATAYAPATRRVWLYEHLTPGAGAVCPHLLERFLAPCFTD